MPDYQLYADYDRDGRASGRPNEYALRQTRPGGILVANLDVDSRREPRFASAASSGQLDWQSTTITELDGDGGESLHGGHRL